MHFKSGYTLFTRLTLTNNLQNIERNETSNILCYWSGDVWLTVGEHILDF